MRNSLWDKKISTFLGLILIGIGIFATSSLVKKSTNFIGKAGPSETPIDLRVTNISDNSFTISYKTQVEVFGSISFGLDNNLGNSVLDDRDQTDGKTKAYKIHSITAKNLNPSTKYFFSILSGQSIFLNGEEPFEVSTGPILTTSPPNQPPISGKVLMENNQLLKEALVYLKTENAQSISTLVKPDGNYILPLNSLRTSDLNSYMNLSEETPLKMLFSADQEESNVLVPLKQTSPVPPIVLSKNYDFTINESPLASSSASTGFPSLNATESTKDPRILAPKKDETFIDPQPLFKGTASPGASLKILINSKAPLEIEVKADKNGNWTYRPSLPLEVGAHTISIVAKDKFGITKTITSAFSVYAQGSQVNESATPSATPILTLTPTITPLPSPTIAIPTPFPTATIAPTIIATPIPSPIPTLPPTGSSSVATFGVIGLATTFIGILLFLLTRGGASL